MLKVVVRIYKEDGSSVSSLYENVRVDLDGPHKVIMTDKYGKELHNILLPHIDFEGQVVAHEASFLNVDIVSYAINSFGEDYIDEKWTISSMDLIFRPSPVQHFFNFLNQSLVGA